jgi:DNA-binding transcriptional ArsR family regulator
MLRGGAVPGTWIPDDAAVDHRPEGGDAPTAGCETTGVTTPQPMTISDPAVMRALAHPARLAIMDHLTSTGAAVTATECAGVVGLSPSATSYHLRALANAGLVEEAPSRGDARERLWRSAGYSWGVDAGQQADPEARAAEQTLVEIFLSQEVERTRDWLRRAPHEPKEWYDTAVQSRSILLLTAEELSELNGAVMKLLESYRRRTRVDPPAGARTITAYYKVLPVD